MIGNDVKLIEYSKKVDMGNCITHAVAAVLSVPAEKDRLPAARIIAEKGMSVRQTEALAVNLGKRKEKREKKPVGIDYLALAAKHLESSLGRGVRMTEGKKGGKIEIDYYDGRSWETGTTPPPKDEDNNAGDGTEGGDYEGSYVINTSTKKIHLPSYK